MINSIQDLTSLLADTALSERAIAEIPILETGETAFAIDIATHEVEANWQLCRSLLSQTQRWPIATTLWIESGSTWTDKILAQDLFSRFYYQEAPNPVDVSPCALCALADTVDVASFLKRKAARRAEFYDLEDCIDYQLETTNARCNTPLDRDAIQAGQVNGHPLLTHQDLEQFLLNWEEVQGVSLDLENARQEWFEPDSCALLLLPTIEGWNTLAYLNWFGTSDYGAEYYIALGRSWEQRFGAELVAHYGTMLQCRVSCPPATLPEAWTLACEHDLAGECTLVLPGIHLRDYARALIGWSRWFLHERP